MQNPREKMRIHFMMLHHEWLRDYWNEVADHMLMSNPERRKTYMKAQYHARRAKHFMEVLNKELHGGN